eukprot:TRINITY_DN3380_c0_g1_i2.p1 TRINITY_DN3380_c0_g1~~TRINITY_DN3380_c0_g1_i2.p1  ORF type:complete len:555 (-),score=200.20 TRINITY_DN3380_c0_g1_i2:30-1694(-)
MDISDEIVVEPKRGPNYLSQRIVATVRKAKASGLNETAPEQFVIEMPQNIAAIDLDIIKTTAQFVARNGHQFQIGLMNREHNNPQFDFLKNNHFHNGFFLGLVETYTKCLLPPKNLVEKFQTEYKDKQTLLDRLILKYEIERREEAAKQAEKDKHDRDMADNSAVDWHDFVVVETIEFLENDDEMVPEVPQLSTTVRMAEDVDMEMETDQDLKSRPPTGLNIRKDYVRPSARAGATTGFVQCPRCQQQVPVEEIDEHMKMELLDPRARNQRQTPGLKNTPLASDEEIGRNLGAFARKRTDIFVGKELPVGQSTDPEDVPKKDDAAIWDGHSGSVGRTMSSVMAGKTMEDQIAAIHAAKGLGRPSEEKIIEAAPVRAPYPPPMSMPPGMPPMGAPPGMGGPPMMPPGIPPPMKYAQQPPPMPPTQMFTHAQPRVQPLPVEPPPQKRQKLEDAFVPEADWIAQHPGPLTVQIQVPKEEKADSKLQGQTINLAVNPTDTLTSIKEKLKEQLGLAPNKQKLKTATIPIMKDQQSLASYNILNGTTIVLDLKQRGGKNK